MEVKTMERKPRYMLTIEGGNDPTDPDAIRRLRSLLKRLLRDHRLRCVALAPVTVPSDDDIAFDRAVDANGEESSP